MCSKNAADQIFDASSFPKAGEPSSGYGQRAISSVPSDCGSPSDAIREIDSSLLESLLDAYFDTIHSDFPVLHEASYREAYEIWSQSTSSTADPAWLCGLLCVLILSRRVASVDISEDTEKKWWRHVQTLLPTVFFSSTMYAVQALMLAALHLHNTNHRDACWNLTGTAVRVAYAIGLHRDDNKSMQSPLGRELRKQLWWTLYAFEQMQVSSYDRPSAIAHTLSTVGCPNERIVGLSGHCPPDLMQWSQKLAVLLASACKALNPAGTGATSAAEDTYGRPLSPVVGILRDLERWREHLPAHLRLEVTDSLAPSSQRPLLLLHAQFYYILIVISRSALLRRATIVTKNSTEHIPQALTAVSESCIDAGRQLAKILRKLETINKFNALTWWDIFYTVTTAMVLVLDVRIKMNESPEAPAESHTLLRELAALADRQKQHPKLPDTMKTLTRIVGEVSTTADEFTRPRTHPSSSRHQQNPHSSSSDQSHPGHAQHRQSTSSAYESSAVPPTPDEQHVISHSIEHPYPVQHGMPQASPSEGMPNDDSMMARQEHAPQFWAQLSFLDDGGGGEHSMLGGMAQDWSWEDINTMLRGR